MKYIVEKRVFIGGCRCELHFCKNKDAFLCSFHGDTCYEQFLERIVMSKRMVWNEFVVHSQPCSDKVVSSLKKILNKEINIKTCEVLKDALRLIERQHDEITALSGVSIKIKDQVCKTLQLIEGTP